MKTISSDIIIIGGGLTGLAIAYYLRNTGTKIHILEARARLGGRILTSYNNDSAPIEMGATWLGKTHTHLIQLLKELGLDMFQQELGTTAIYEPISTSPHQLVSLPPNSDPSYRIKGGSSSLIHALEKHMKDDIIHTSRAVLAIHEKGDEIYVECKDLTYKATTVVSTLPPNLLISNIDIKPTLPTSLLDISAKTHTWMGESIKVGLRFEEPFWRDKNMSGTIFSNVGPIPEMYDHSNDEDNYYALKGFLNGNYFSISKKERLNIVLNQLRKYYGNQVDQFTTYEEVVWRNEPFTYTDYDDHILPHQNNGHPLFSNSYLNGKLFISGSETAAQFPGYMEGAIRSAKHISEQLKPNNF